MWSTFPYSAHDADLPRHEFIVSEAQQLALGAFAGSRPEHLFENALSHFLQGAGSVQNLAAVDVHVFLETAVHRGVGRQLDARNRLGAKHRTPTGSECNQIGAAS